MNIFRNLIYKFQQFMVGRYGFDQLTKFLLILTLVFYCISSFTAIAIFRLLAIASLVYAYYRMFSKNIYKRRIELDRYLAQKSKAMRKINLYKKMWAERRTYKYFKCSKCKSVWRVPKGKGKIELTCKTCNNKMIKRT